MSKKKNKRRQKHAKTLTREVKFVVHVNDDTLCFSIDQSSLQIMIENNDALNSQTKTSYQREKGEKVVNLTPTNPQKTFIMPDKSIINNSDMIFVVDTNTKIIYGEKKSFAAIIQLKKVIKNYQMALMHFVPFCFSFTCKEKQELVSIIMLIRIIAKSLIAQEKKRIVIVTDTELGNIPKYNTREIPLYGSFYLPDNITIAYASADTGNDIINDVIKKADKIASMLFAYFKEKELPANTGETIPNLCSDFQIIYPKNSCVKGNLSY